MHYSRSRWSVGVTLAAICVFIFGLVSAPNYVLGETAEEIFGKIKTKQKDLKSYEADVTIKLTAMGMTTGAKVSFKKPNSFRMVATSNMGGMQIKQVMVSNGKAMHIKSESPQMTQYQKLDLTQVDLGAMGGTVNPSDFSNIENIFGSTADAKSLPKETVDEQEMHVLEGKVNMGNAAQIAGPQNPMANVDKAKVWVGTKDLFIHKVEMYTKEGKTVMTTQLKNIKLNPSLSSDLFTMKIPEGANVMDITPMLKNMMKQQQGGNK